MSTQLKKKTSSSSSDGHRRKHVLGSTYRAQPTPLYQN